MICHNLNFQMMNHKKRKNIKKDLHGQKHKEKHFLIQKTIYLKGTLVQVCILKH